MALLLGGVLGALVIGGGIAYWVIGRSPGLGGALPVGAQITPEDAFMTVTVSTNEGQWSQLQKLGTPESQALLQNNIRLWRDRLLTANDLTYAEHIKPWVGDEITIAIMAPQTLPVPVPESSSPDASSDSESQAELPESSDSATSDDEESDFNPDEMLAESPASEDSPAINSDPDSDPDLDSDADSEPLDSAPTSEDPSTENGETDTALEEGDRPSADSPEPDSAEANSAEANESLPSAGLNPNLIDPSQTQTAVLFLPIADPLKAQGILTQITESDSPPDERDYEGVTIQSFQSPNGESLDAVVLDRQLVALSLEPEAIEQVIDTYRGNASIVNVPGYRQALREVTAASSFAKVYVNAQVAEAIASANTTESGRDRTLAPLQNNQGLAASISLNPAGIRLQGTTWLTKDSPRITSLNRNRNLLAERLPADTMMMASGSSLKLLWDGYRDRAGNRTEGVLAPKNIETAFQSVFGLNLEADVIAWMDGWFSLALLPTEAAEAVQSAGLVFLVEANDPAAAKQTLTRLDEVMQSRFQFEVNNVTISGQEAVNWRSRFASLTITRGWLDNSTAFLAFNDATKNLLPQPSQTLADSELYRKATQSSFNSNSGTFFVNVEALNGARDQIPVPQFPENQAAIVNAIRAIGVTTSVEGDRQLRYDISVITKNGNPGASPTGEL
ncbi:MAG: DUF3352 domain-containing protein [Elainellaceae cyanobacterium]